MTAERDTTSYNNQSKQTLAGAKLLVAGEINTFHGSGKAAISVTATPQEVMYSPIGNFTNQAGASMEAIITPFQINGGSSKLPTMPTSAGSTCIPSQSNEIDPPLKESKWNPPAINISYLNPFRRTSDAKHHTGDPGTYDGTVVFNGDKTDEQNLVNIKAAGGSMPNDLRPMALRGPMVLQGWGYDMEGKPIPNEIDTPSAARGGTFESDNLKDRFMQGWIEQRDTWPVAPVDLRYDRDRKVWTVPHGFRIIHAQADSEGIEPGATNIECTPLNLNTVYGTEGGEVDLDNSIKVKNPSFQKKIGPNEQFHAYFDTKECVYMAIKVSGDPNCLAVASGDPCSESESPPSDFNEVSILQFNGGAIAIPFDMPDEGLACPSGYTIQTIHRLDGNVFGNLVISSGLDLRQTEEQIGTCDYTLVALTGEGGGACTHQGTSIVPYVSDICCVASGINVAYGTMTFIDGCFSGYIPGSC